ncbi:hypothetical protein TRFO_10430 [Tritrichomonas foetus]|uniref:Uncharacterized protein n=1 Tax=Tritrichomonas foetus TaxID=1144522 RepID=A0A1J4J8S9_9EUKA|nr:hypothetical protein TRFO_10430 [Tritrichomonas foetus]|eukprot:OHS95544.1 hypothetical protein TRFO_10430 [Tritrichomonas foetus]
MIYVEEKNFFINLTEDFSAFSKFWTQWIFSKVAQFRHREYSNKINFKMFFCLFFPVFISLIHALNQNSKGQKDQFHEYANTFEKFINSLNRNSIKGGISLQILDDPKFYGYKTIFCPANSRKCQNLNTKYNFTSDLDSVIVSFSNRKPIQIKNPASNYSTQELDKYFIKQFEEATVDISMPIISPQSLADQFKYRDNLILLLYDSKIDSHNELLFKWDQVISNDLFYINNKDTYFRRIDCSQYSKECTQISPALPSSILIKSNNVSVTLDPDNVELIKYFIKNKTPSGFTFDPNPLKSLHHIDFNDKNNHLNDKLQSKNQSKYTFQKHNILEDSAKTICVYASSDSKCTANQIKIGPGQYHNMFNGINQDIVDVYVVDPITSDKAKTFLNFSKNAKVYGMGSITGDVFISNNSNVDFVDFDLNKTNLILDANNFTSEKTMKITSNQNILSLTVSGNNNFPKYKEKRSYKVLEGKVMSVFIENEKHDSNDYEMFVMGYSKGANDLTLVFSSVSLKTKVKFSNCNYDNKTSGFIEINDINDILAIKSHKIQVHTCSPRITLDDFPIFINRKYSIEFALSNSSVEFIYHEKMKDIVDSILFSKSEFATNEVHFKPDMETDGKEKIIDFPKISFNGLKYNSSDVAILFLQGDYYYTKKPKIYFDKSQCVKTETGYDCTIKPNGFETPGLIAGLSIAADMKNVVIRLNSPELFSRILIYNEHSDQSNNNEININLFDINKPVTFYNFNRLNVVPQSRSEYTNLIDFVEVYNFLITAEHRIQHDDLTLDNLQKQMLLNSKNGIEIQNLIISMNTSLFSNYSFIHKLTTKSSDASVIGVTVDSLLAISDSALMLHNCLISGELFFDVTRKLNKPLLSYNEKTIFTPVFAKVQIKSEFEENTEITLISKNCQNLQDVHLENTFLSQTATTECQTDGKLVLKIISTSTTTGKPEFTISASGETNEIFSQYVTEQTTIDSNDIFSTMTETMNYIPTSSTNEAYETITSDQIFENPEDVPKNIELESKKDESISIGVKGGKEMMIDSLKVNTDTTVVADNLVISKKLEISGNTILKAADDSKIEIIDDVTELSFNSVNKIFPLLDVGVIGSDYSKTPKMLEINLYENISYTVAIVRGRTLNCVDWINKARINGIFAKDVSLVCFYPPPDSKVRNLLDDNLPHESIIQIKPNEPILPFTNNQTKPFPVGGIVGIVVGVAVVIIVAVFIFCFCKRNTINYHYNDSDIQKKNNDNDFSDFNLEI